MWLQQGSRVCQIGNSVDLPWSLLLTDVVMHQWWGCLNELLATRIWLQPSIVAVGIQLQLSIMLWMPLVLLDKMLLLLLPVTLLLPLLLLQVTLLLPLLLRQGWLKARCSLRIETSRLWMEVFEASFVHDKSGSCNLRSYRSVDEKQWLWHYGMQICSNIYTS